MDEKTREEFTVNGFLFGSKADVELAKNELTTVKYIDKKIENRNADTILSVFQGAVERKMFRTPIGYSYLHELQKRMASQGMERSKIPSVPLFQVYNNQFADDEKPRRTTTVPKKKKRDDVVRMNRTLIMVNVILILLIAVLFYISVNASNPNILNYRTAIQNEYSEWEQELKEREARVREKEQQLNIDASLYENNADTE